MKWFFPIPLLMLTSTLTGQTPTADQIFFNGRIWTGNLQQPWADAMALSGQHILYTGSDFKTYQDSKTEMTDLKGKMLLPGFIDNHTHFLSGGYGLSGVNLRKASSPQEFISILADYCKKYNDDRWILGGDWDHEAWGGQLPEKEWIDSVTGNHPLFVSRYDGHMAFANSKALQLAGITENSATPAGGEIVKNGKGICTGVFKDEAMGLINKVVPDPSEKELAEYLQAAQQHAIENGVTQVHDMGSYGGWPDLTTYRKARDKGKLIIRIYSFVAMSSWKKLLSFCNKNGKGDDHLRWGGLKAFVDGSLGSTTAWFHKPYLDAPHSHGLMVTDTHVLRNQVLESSKANFHVAVHAIGDKANDFILDVFQEALYNEPAWDKRFRIEHAQHLTDEAINKMARLQVIASMQPYHAIDDGRWAAKRLDPARLKGTYAFKSLLHAPAKLTFGSDWTVAPLSPLEGIYAAVTRRTLDNKNPGGWYPEQKISVQEALECYTVNNAFAGFQETKLGQMKAGMLADFVVLSENLFEIPPEKIKDVQVLMTVIGGRIVFRK